MATVDAGEPRQWIVAYLDSQGQHGPAGDPPVAWPPGYRSAPRSNSPAPSVVAPSLTTTS
jgi:hypothetical protein